MQWACLRSCEDHPGSGGFVVGLPPEVGLGLSGLLQKSFVDADADDPAVPAVVQRTRSGQPEHALPKLA
jgi:hypothetical protein